MTVNWSPLEMDVCITVANAKHNEFINQSFRVAEMVRLGLLTKAAAADVLHEAATYNGLNFEYGTDHVQEIMAATIGSEVAA